MPDTAVPADLAEIEGSAWERVAVPEGWTPVAELARRVADDLAELSHHVVERIGSEIEAYGHETMVPRQDLAASVHRNLEVILLGLAERRGPRPEELVVRRELGARRAAQGLPIDALIQAYHVGYRELWAALVRQLSPGDVATATLLLSAATTVWSWIHQVTQAIAGAYTEALRDREAHAIDARQRFAELLLGAEPPGEEVQRLAATLGFDPAGHFVAILARITSPDAAVVVDLQARLTDRGGVHAVVPRGTHLAVMSQSIEPDAVLAVIRDRHPTATIGVGLVRVGLAGASASLGDAHACLAKAADGETVTFADAWLWATLHPASDRLRDILEIGIQVARQHPHLADAVEAFAGSGFSASETARRLALHANTVTYRLERWEKLTGWDPRTFSGLVCSMAALHLRTDA